MLALSGCASLPDNSQRTASYVITDTQDSKVAKGFREKSEPYPEGQSAYLLLDDGLVAFVARALLAGGAEL